jgi:hypothetical protein
MDRPAPITIELSDFDAVGVLSEVVVTLRAHVMATDSDAAATIDAPAGWQHVVVTAKPGGSSVLVVRYGELSMSRMRNVADALHGRGWQLDEDGEGATLRRPPGTPATDVAFEVLAVLVVAGAPATERSVSATAADGTPIDLHP